MINVERYLNSNHTLQRIGWLNVLIEETGDILFKLPMIIRPANTMGPLICTLCLINIDDKDKAENCVFVNENAMHTEDLNEYIALTALQYIMNNDVFIPDIPIDINSIAMLTIFKGYTEEKAIEIMRRIIDIDYLDLRNMDRELKLSIKVWLLTIVDEFLKYNKENGKEDFFKGVENYMKLELKVEFGMPNLNPIS